MNKKLYPIVILILTLTSTLFSCLRSNNKEAQTIELTAENIDSLLNISPDSVSLLLFHGNLALQDYRFLDALSDGARAFRLDSNNIEVRMLYALALNNKENRTIEDITTAQRHFQYVLNKQPTNTDALVAIATTYRSLQDVENAFKFVNEALRIDPKKREAYALKGSIYLDLENYKLAKSSYETAVQQDPTFYEAYLHLAMIYHREANPLSLEYYQTAYELKPNDAELLYSLAFAQESFGKWNEALENYRLLAENKDAYYKSHGLFHIGHIKQRKTNEIDSALHYYSQAIKTDKQYVEAYHNRGMCYEIKGNIQSAKLEYMTAIRLDKNFQLSIDAYQKLIDK